MGLFSFTQEIAIDLGTANTIIICDDKVVVDEPSVVAISMTENKMVAVGRKAQQMIGKGGTLIRTVRPLRDGVIADFYGLRSQHLPSTSARAALREVASTL